MIASTSKSLMNFLKIRREVLGKKKEKCLDDFQMGDKIVVPVIDDTFEDDWELVTITKVIRIVHTAFKARIECFLSNGYTITMESETGLKFSADDLYEGGILAPDYYTCHDMFKGAGERTFYVFPKVEKNTKENFFTIKLSF